MTHSLASQRCTYLSWSPLGTQIAWRDPNRLAGASERGARCTVPAHKPLLQRAARRYGQPVETGGSRGIHGHTDQPRGQAVPQAAAGRHRSQPTQGRPAEGDRAGAPKHSPTWHAALVNSSSGAADWPGDRCAARVGGLLPNDGRQLPGRARARARTEASKGLWSAASAERHRNAAPKGPAQVCARTPASPDVGRQCHQGPAQLGRDAACAAGYADAVQLDAPGLKVVPECSAAWCAAIGVIETLERKQTSQYGKVLSEYPTLLASPRASSASRPLALRCAGSDAD